MATAKKSPKPAAPQKAAKAPAAKKIAAPASLKPIKTALNKVPGVANVKSSVVLREIKYETALPVD